MLISGRHNKLEHNYVENKARYPHSYAVHKLCSRLRIDKFPYLLMKKQLLKINFNLKRQNDTLLKFYKKVKKKKKLLFNFLGGFILKS